MKKNLFRKAIIVSALTLSMIMSASCGAKADNNTTTTATEATTDTTTDATTDATTEGAIDTSKAVEVVMYLLGDAPVDDQIVWDKINEKLSSKINTTVKVNHIPWTDVAQRYQLLFTSGEAFDTAYSGNFMNYASMASKNAYMEITDEMINKYMPETVADLDPFYIKGAKVGGKLYMVPANQHSYRTNLVMIRGDLREKYGIAPLTSIDDLQKYVDAVAKNGEITAINTSANDDDWFHYTFRMQYPYKNLTNCEGVSVVSPIGADGPQVLNMFETPEFLAYAQREKELNTNGAFSKSMLSAQNNLRENFEAGNSAVASSNLAVFDVKGNVMRDHPEWKPEVYDLSNKEFNLDGLSPTDAGMSLNINAKNPERALMAINLLREDKELFDLTYCGIEGTHYTAPEDGKFTPSADAANYPWNANCPWGWGNDKFLRVSTDVSDELNTIQADWDSRGAENPLLVFQFDDSNVQSEMAALANIRTKYLPLLSYGFVDDVQGTIDTMNNEMKASGLEKVQAEYKSQIDAWWADYNAQ